MSATCENCGDDDAVTRTLCEACDPDPAEELTRLRAELDGVRAENQRLQHALDNPALRDSVIAELDRELEAAHREELQAKAEAKRLREALAELLDAHQYGHGDRWCDAWAAARAAEPTP